MCYFFSSFELCFSSFELCFSSFELKYRVSSYFFRVSSFEFQVNSKNITQNSRKSNTHLAELYLFSYTRTLYAQPTAGSKLIHKKGLTSVLFPIEWGISQVFSCPPTWDPSFLTFLQIISNLWCFMLLQQ